MTASGVKARFGFLHAGEGARVATDAALAAFKLDKAGVHLVDPGLVDASATEFPIDEVRYRAILACAAELARRCDRILLTCSVYNGVAGLLQDDLGIQVQRSDAAAVNELTHTTGTVGILLSYLPSRGVVVDYVSQALANGEAGREIQSSVAEETNPFETPPAVYQAKLLQALEPLRDADVLLVAQYTMNAHLDAIKSANKKRPLISALDAAMRELAAA